MTAPLSDSIAERYKLCDDDLALIEPQIRGLEDKVNDALSEPLRSVLVERLNYLKDRQTKVHQLQASQKAADDAAAVLEADGFPALPDMAIPADLLAELDREGADDAAARGGFTAATPMATTVKFELGNPVNNP